MGIPEEKRKAIQPKITVPAGAIATLAWLWSFWVLLARGLDWKWALLAWIPTDPTTTKALLGFWLLLPPLFFAGERKFLSVAGEHQEPASAIWAGMAAALGSTLLTSV